MPESTLNCQHLPNPSPANLVRILIKSGPPQAFNVIVDNISARDEVVRLLGLNGYYASIVRDGKIWRLHAIPGAGCMPGDSALCEGQLGKISRQQGRILFLLLSDKIGAGDDTLGERLMNGFLGGLPFLGMDLWRIILMNGAVRLAAFDSSVLGQLKNMEKAGVSIQVCSECVLYFDMKAKLAIGDIVKIDEIMQSLHLAEKVIRI